MRGLAAVQPVCSSTEERLFLQHFILDRIAMRRPSQSYHFAPRSPQESGVVIAECFERLAREGHIDDWLLPDALADSATRQLREDRDRLIRENKLLTAEIESLRRSRALAISRAVRRLLGFSHTT